MDKSAGAQFEIASSSPSMAPSCKLVLQPLICNADAAWSPEIITCCRAMRVSTLVDMSKLMMQEAVKKTPGRVRASKDTVISPSCLEI